MRKYFTKGLFLIPVIFLFSCKTIDIEGTWISQSCKKGSITVDCYVLIQGGVIQNGGGPSNGGVSCEYKKVNGKTILVNNCGDKFFKGNWLVNKNTLRSPLGSYYTRN